MKKATLLVALLGLALSSFSQSLLDVKKSISAEQYQKAKGYLLNLLNTQPKNAEINFFLGKVYLITEESDSAKAIFQKGIDKDPEYTLNYVGLGEYALEKGDTSGARKQFEKALSLAKKKDYLTFMYIGEAYHSLKENAKALEYLKKANERNNKDARLYLLIGDVNLAMLKNSDALSAYDEALILDRGLRKAYVSKGVIWKMALNFEASEQEFNEALKIDPNFGPAYRELAEMYLRWGNVEPKNYKEKVSKALEFYKKYLDNTDLSIHSRMRYADFLILAKEYKTLEEVAQSIAKEENKNARIYRYLGYAAYENGSYSEAEKALTSFLTQAESKRVIGRDYLYLGKTQLKLSKDSLAILNLKKSVEMDSTNILAFGEIAKEAYKAKQYEKAAECYEMVIEKNSKASIQDRFNYGMACFWTYNAQVNKQTQDSTHTFVPNRLWLQKADSAFTYVSRVSSTTAMTYYYKAKVTRFVEASAEEAKAVPYYQTYLDVLETKPEEKEKSKKQIAEAYNYFAEVALRKDKDINKAKEVLNKVLVVDPDNKTAKAVLEQLSTPVPTPKKTVKGKK